MCGAAGGGVGEQSGPSVSGRAGSTFRVPRGRRGPVARAKKDLSDPRGPARDE